VVVSDFPGGTSALHPARSPAGRRIAVAVGTTGQADSDIWVIDLDEPPNSPDRQVLLTSGGHGDVNPTWSPDGTRIAFVRGDAILSIAADGSSPAPMPHYQDAATLPAAPHWGLPGFVLQAYEGGVSGYRIASVDSGGGGFGVHTSGGAQVADLTPKWSADGAQILFARDGSGAPARRLRVGTAAAPDSDVEVAGQPAGDNADPDW
jgi:Tol biopolymer transport system component